MTQENLEVVRRSFEALVRGDFETAFADHDADIEWQTAADEPDRETYRGREGLRRFVAAVDEPWEDRFCSTVELKDFIARGDWVLVPWRARLHGRGSGLEVEVIETYAVLVRDGKIVRVDEYRTTEEAQEALGPSDPGHLGDR